MRHDRRPLLGLRRRETRALCDELGISPLHDPMNDDDRFQRVRVRDELLPLLGNISKRDIVDVLARQAKVLRDDEDVLEELAAMIDPTDAKALSAAPIALARRAIRQWLSNPKPPDLATVERVLAVAHGDAAACDVGAGREVRRSHQRLGIRFNNMM
jgi:tRNA(Ile)-lysidine synthase